MLFILIFFLLLIFGILVYIFRKIMVSNLAQATRHIEQLSQEYAKKEEQINLKYQEFELKSQEIIEKAEQEAQKIKAQYISEAEREKEKIIAQARQQANQIIEQADKSRQALLLELEERIEKAAIDKACYLIQETLPEDFRKIVHQHWVEDLINEGLMSFKNLHIPEDIREAELLSAFPLEEDKRQNIREKLKSIFGKEFELKEKVEPQIVAGLIIILGSLVLDGSLKNKIRQKAQNVK